MKTLWSMLSFLAVVNLLALLFAGGWLWWSGRLDRARIDRIRTLLAEPIAAAADVAGGAEGDGTAVDPATAPAPSAVEARQLSRVREHELLARRRMEAQRDQLRAELGSAVEALASQREADAAAAAARQAATDADRSDEAAAQFAKAVRQLESIPAKQAKAILATLVADGDPDRAVAYLDAMNPRAAAKVLREFKQPGEVELAADLLERLRTFDPETPADASAGLDAS